ncbi:MAG TPA: fatty acid oxidation complex subunit alpha FadJ [Gemmatimonadaceae bacterium]|nr:fatty acid oxidation complex subunit alpha FadJ [Gemmatimonadaceae bacterium]
MATMTEVATENALSVEMEDGGIAVIVFDLPNEPVNKFNRKVKDEFVSTFERLEADPAVRGVVLISGKPDMYIAGADIEEFLEIKSAADAERLSIDGQTMLNRISRGRLSVVAAIDGPCLGGGLEASLAMAYRIATDNPKTILALPEVQLGLIPGAGGTQRLPRTVGLRNALDMILTGKNVRAKKALQIGLIDELVHPSILRAVAVDRARQLADGKIKRRRPRSHGPADLVLEDNPIGRAVVLRQAREMTVKKSKGHYPAPLAAIEAIQSGYADGFEKGLAEEARLFGEMAMTDVSRELIFLFFATTASKRDPGVEGRAPTPKEVNKLGVLGAGFMGSGIAVVAAQQGTPVRMKDAKREAVGRGLKAARDVLKEKLKRKQITRRQFDDQMILISGTTEYTGFGNVDLLIEAVFEDLQVKHGVVREVEGIIPRHAIFASNTSTIPIARIADVSKRPDQFIGMHFFSPVHKMPLLEVIVTERTSAETVVTTVAYGKKLGKTVIVVNDSPGFYVNRILSPYVNEAGRLLDEGVAVDAIDKALVDFGFPVGPLTLIDEVGLDIARKSGEVMYEAFGERMAPSSSIRKVVEAGRLGRKGKKGFYKYDDAGKKGGVDESVYELFGVGQNRKEMSAQEIQERCVLAMCNEAVLCLQEGVLRKVVDGDIGAVFGIGFPPFRGGPFRYLQSVGLPTVEKVLERLHGDFAPRYEAADLLVRMARAGDRFYPKEGKPV